MLLLLLSVGTFSIESYLEPRPFYNWGFEEEDSPPPFTDTHGNKYELQVFRNEDGTWTVRQTYCFEPRSYCFHTDK